MGKTSFSRIISGVMTWGVWGKNLSTTDMARRIEEYAALGISTFDNADIYGDYSTEAAFGAALKESGVDRKAVQIITKCGIKRPCAARSYSVKHYDLSPIYIKLSVDESLKNLQTDYLDLLLLHRPSPLMDASAVADAVEELLESKKILRFGVSNFTSSQLSLLLSKVDVDVNQIELSLLRPAPLSSGLLEYHTLCDIVTMAWAPFGKFFKNTDEQTERLTLVLQSLTQEYGAAPEQILLAWLLKHPAQVHPVIGTTEPSRARLSVEALRIDLKLEDWFKLLEASQGHSVA